MTGNTDLDALIAEARIQGKLRMQERLADQKNIGSFMHHLADALESTLAELRQERERARDAEERMRLLDQANDEEIDRTDKAEAALSRAEENTFIDRVGSRVCRTCMRAAQREWWHAEGKRKRPAPVVRTHCVKGHPLSGENLYLDPRGWRACRECRRDRKQAARRKAKES